MQSRNKQINELRKTLQLAKTNLYIDGKLNRPLSSDLIDALSSIGKEKIYELTKEVYELLDTPNVVARESVVTTLGLISCLHLPEFKETAYKMWLEDADNIVKGAALRAWASYSNATRNPQTLKVLYKILVDESYPVEHRLDAMAYIFFVSQEPSNFFNPFQSRHFHMVSSHQEFNQKVDWNEIKAIIKKYAPDALS